MSRSFFSVFASRSFIVSSLIVSIKSDKEILRKFDEVNWDQTMKKKTINMWFLLCYVLRAFENHKGFSRKGEHIQMHLRNSHRIWQMIR